MMKKIPIHQSVCMVILLGMIVLLALILPDLGTDHPVRQPSSRRTDLYEDSVPVETAAKLVRSEFWSGVLRGTNAPAPNPFFTIYFQPRPQAAKPAESSGPPVPTTRKVEVVFQGTFETTSGVVQGFVKVGDALIVGPPGTLVTGDFRIATADVKSLVLTNGAGTRTPVAFNQKVALEIPAK